MVAQLQEGGPVQIASRAVGGNVFVLQESHQRHEAPVQACDGYGGEHGMKSVAASVAQRQKICKPTNHRASAPEYLAPSHTLHSYQRSRNQE